MKIAWNMCLSLGSQAQVYTQIQDSDQSQYLTFNTKCTGELKM